MGWIFQAGGTCGQTPSSVATVGDLMIGSMENTCFELSDCMYYSEHWGRGSLHRKQRSCGHHQLYPSLSKNSYISILKHYWHIRATGKLLTEIRPLSPGITMDADQKGLKLQQHLGSPCIDAGFRSLCQYILTRLYPCVRIITGEIGSWRWSLISGTSWPFNEFVQVDCILELDWLSLGLFSLKIHLWASSWVRFSFCWF